MASTSHGVGSLRRAAGGTGFSLRPGSFALERRDGRWWLVTPEGHGFFSLGIDVVSPDVGATFVEGRKPCSPSFPDPGSPLAAHYGYADERGSLPGRAGPAIRSRAEFRLLRRQSAAQIRPGLPADLARYGDPASARLGLQHDRQLERTEIAAPGARWPMSCRSTYTEISPE